MTPSADFPEADLGSLRVSKSMNLKHQLASLLDHRGMTAAALSRKAGVPKQALSRWLAGQAPKDVSQLKKVADALGVTVDHLLFGAGIEDESRKVTDVSSLVGDGWISGVFEVRLRRVKSGGSGK